MASELEVGKVGVGVAPSTLADFKASSANGAKIKLINSDYNNTNEFTAGIGNLDIFANTTTVLGAAYRYLRLGVGTTEAIRIDTTGLATFSGGIKNEQGIYGGQITIADDAVGTITPPRQGVMMAISYGNDSAYPAHQNMAGLIWCDTGSSLTCAKLTSEGSSLSVGTSDLTVAAGVDGNINIAAISGTIQIKNRVNSTIIIWYNFIA